MAQQALVDSDATWRTWPWWLRCCVRRIIHESRDGVVQTNREFVLTLEEFILNNEVIIRAC